MRPWAALTPARRLARTLAGGARDGKEIKDALALLQSLGLSSHVDVVPGPLLRMHEGRDVTIALTNRLDEVTAAQLLAVTRLLGDNFIPTEKGEMGSAKGMCRVNETRPWD